MLHVDPGTPCVVGNDVTIGHGAIVHGTTIGDGVTVGMGAVVLSRSSVGARAVIAAGAVVAEDAVVAPGALMMGVPAKERRIMDDEQQAGMMLGGPRVRRKREPVQGDIGRRDEAASNEEGARWPLTSRSQAEWRPSR